MSILFLPEAAVINAKVALEVRVRKVLVEVAQCLYHENTEAGISRRREVDGSRQRTAASEVEG